MGRDMTADFTDEEMILGLQRFYAENKRRPYMKDFKGKIPSDSMIAKRFGSWSNAIEKANIPKGKLREGDYSKEELINQVHDFVIKNKKPPTTREMRKQGYAGIHSFINHFGSFKNALIEANVFELREDKHQFCDTYADEQMLDNLREYMKGKDKIPVQAIIKEEIRNPSISAYERRFYSIFNALKLIGYDYEKQKEEELIELENDMLNKYKELKDVLDRVPSSRDIDRYSKKGFGYAMKTYDTHFGSLSELQILCGFIPTVVGRSKSRTDMINDLIEIAEEIGKTPPRLDLKYFNNIASEAKYRLEFGSWNNAIKEAGLKPNDKIYYSTNGITCLSYYELLFTNMFETYQIDFLKGEYYNKYLDTNRRFRFDFIISLDGKQYFVEIFGITNNDKYEEKSQLKIALCEENNLSLIEVYPQDFTSYKLEDIHKILLNKINLM